MGELVKKAAEEEEISHQQMSSGKPFDYVSDLLVFLASTTFSCCELKLFR